MRTHFTGKPNLPPVVKQMREWQNDLNERLKGREIPPKYWEFPELEKGNIHKNHCAYCIDIYCDQTRNDSNKSKLNLSTNCAMTSCKYGCGARYHVCKTSEHLLICTIGDVENEYNKMYQGVSGEQRRSSGASLSSASFWSDKYFSDSFNKTNEKRKSLKRTENISKLFAPKHFQTIGDWLEGPKERANTNINSKMKTNPPEPPVVETLERNQLNKGMMVNLSFTNESKHTAKATEVYSFTCSQMFRRDQFEWHSKNVHDDIFGGLHDWVEHRCPLASYGCGFSVRRLHPKANHNLSNQGNYRCLSLIYSPLLESIGVSITDNTPVEDTMRNELLMLPCEILYQIFHHIDSFSLCNVALTCKYFRKICQSFLFSRGCIHHQWQKSTESDQVQWVPGRKKWFFSTAIDPIVTWKLEEKRSISDHLKICPYNVRTNHSGWNRKDEKWDVLLQELNTHLKQKNID